MRNIFDQYGQQENRLTHALASTLKEDPKVMRQFLQWVLGTGKSIPKHLGIVEQRLPGEEEPQTEQEIEKRGLPDTWIHDGENWSVIIESKIAAPLQRNQLQRHLRMAEARGFTNIHLIALVAHIPKPTEYGWVENC